MVKKVMGLLAAVLTASVSAEVAVGNYGDTISKCAVVAAGNDLYKLTCRVHIGRSRWRWLDNIQTIMIKGADIQPDVLQDVKDLGSAEIGTSDSLNGSFNFESDHIHFYPKQEAESLKTSGHHKR